MKMLATLYDDTIQAVNQHMYQIYSDYELTETSVIKTYLIIAADGTVTAELAKAYAESEFEKYRITQDRLFESDFDKLLKLMK